MAAGVVKFHAPCTQAVQCPLITAILVTAGAGIGSADDHAEIRPRNSHAVIPPRVHHHVVAARHMAVHTGGAVGIRRMTMMFLAVVDRGLVALGAHGVALGPQCITVGLVTVGADHTRLVHTALPERPVDIYLVQYLPVRVVQGCSQQAGPMGVQQLPAVVIAAQGAAP